MKSTLLTPPLLNNFFNSLSGTNIVAAHSLGNMVVLSALNDCSNQTINTYLMVDAAIALEDLEGIGTNANFYMAHSDWTEGATNAYGMGYGTNLWASYWHRLFPAGDGRSQLTWENRLANLQNANVYNFYSSGEECLRTYPTRPTPDLTGYIGNGLWQKLWNGVPVSSYVWCLQELEKGRMSADILGSTHGGWKFNDLVYGTNSIWSSTSFTHMSPSAAASLPASELQTNAFFDVTDFIGQIPFSWTQDLTLYGSAGSSYAQANQNRILSDTIPALTLPAGANPVTVQGILAQNFNMNTPQFQNGWPQGRLSTHEGNNWWHSDFHQVAYTFTYKLFDQFVTLGNLK